AKQVGSLHVRMSPCHFVRNNQLQEILLLPRRALQGNRHSNQSMSGMELWKDPPHPTSQSAFDSCFTCKNQYSMLVYAIGAQCHYTLLLTYGNNLDPYCHRVTNTDGGKKFKCLAQIDTSGTR